MAFTAAAKYRVGRTQFHAKSPNEKDDTFFLENGLELSVRSGDITKVEAAVVVVGEDAQFSGGGAIARALIKAGGSEYQQNRDRLKKSAMDASSKEFVYGCPAGSRLKFREVFHALTLFGRGQEIPCWESHMKNLFFHIGLHAENSKAETVATPLLGAGAAGGSVDTSLEGLVDGLSKVSLHYLRKVILVEYDSKKASDMKEKLRRILAQNGKKAEEAAERAEHSRDCRIPGQGPFEASAAGSTGAEEVSPPTVVHMSSAENNEGNGKDKREEFPSASRVQSSHAPGDQPTWNDPNSGNLWWDRPDWCYVNEEGNSTAYLGPNRDLQDLNPDRASYRGLQEYGAEWSFQQPSRSEFDATSRIEILPMPSSSSGFSSFADPTSGSHHQAIPNSGTENEPKPPPDKAGVKKEPMTENQSQLAADGDIDNDADKGTDDSYQGETKRIFQLHATADTSEAFARETRATILEECKNKFLAPANRGQRKSKSCGDGRLQVPDSLQDERPPTTSAGTDHDADFHFRAQRKSKAQVPREDAAVSHQRSSSSPDPGLDGGLPLDTDSTKERTEDTNTAEGRVEDQEQPRMKAADTQSSDQDPGTGSANRGQRKGKRGSAATAEGNPGSDSAITKHSDGKTLKKTVGTMPKGRMNFSAQQGIHVPGYAGCGVISVDYIIPDGIQTPEHPQPGSPYIGCLERAFLPDNDEGRRVLRLLEEAFDRRLIFQVCEQPGGQALVEWADIPHKTCLRGTRDRGGYPDPDYLATVQKLLREKYGIE